jgi:hypothetical protein
MERSNTLKTHNLWNPIKCRKKNCCKTEVLFINRLFVLKTKEFVLKHKKKKKKKNQNV